MKKNKRLKRFQEPGHSLGSLLLDQGPSASSGVGIGGGGGIGVGVVTVKIVPVLTRLFIVASKGSRQVDQVLPGLSVGARSLWP